MALDNYVDFQAAIADHLVRTDFTSQIVDCITLFEAEAANELFRQRLAMNTTILVPGNPAQLTITNCQSNGGLIQVTYSGTPNPTIVTGNEVSIAQVSGTTEANGSWIVTVVNSQSFTLQNSTFINAYVSGGIVQQQQGTAPLPSDYMGFITATWTGNPNYVLEYVTPDIYESEYPNSDTPGLTLDNPKVFTIIGSTFYLMPVSTTPIEFRYYSKTPALSSSLNWLFTNHVNIYWAGVLTECYKYLKDYEQASIWQSTKTGLYQAIKTQLFRETNNLRIRPVGYSYGQTP